MDTALGGCTSYDRVGGVVAGTGRVTGIGGLVLNEHLSVVSAVGAAVLLSFVAFLAFGESSETPGSRPG